MLGSKLNDRYEITAELGRGGMGVVYRARDPLLNRDVAVKLIPPALLSPETELRFQREAQVVAQMDHPSIVSIHDIGRHEGSLFFVMPLVQGTNLHQFRRRRSALGDVVDIAIQVAEALDYSHGLGVVHRDIKPENLMVTEEAGGVRVRVMDFGLARASTANRLTKSGALVGTLAYLSPEQVAAREIDGRSDVYSLGVVLYECVIGAPPFQGDTQSILYRIVHELPQSPRALGAEIDEELDRIILACLEKEPAKRPARAADVAEALKRYRARLRDSDRERALTGLTLATPRPALAPFVGRQKEFGELQQRLNAALLGESQFVVVGGEPGIGKTRLVDELEKLAAARQIRVLRGRSVERDRAFAYQGFCEIIQEHFRLKDTASAPAPEFSDLAPDLVALFPMLNEISDIRQAASRERSAAAGAPAALENKTQIFELLARALTRIAAGRPLVLILEDLHGAEVTIEALSYIVTRLSPTPTLIVGTYRSTEVDDRHPLTQVLDGFRGDRRFLHQTLGPFSPSEHRSFLETLVGGSELSASLVDRIFDAAKGNVFFTRELVRSLLDSGGISRDDTGEWSLSGEAEIAADALPATIQEAVEKRIRRLPEELRDVLTVAAVIGKTFDSRDLETLAKGTDVDDAIDHLVEQGLIEEERESRGEQLSFSSGVVRDVLYGGLSPRKRRSLHRRCAEALEARHAARPDRVLPQLVHHFYQGDVPEKAVAYGLRLVRAYLETFSVDEAVRAAKTVLDCLDEEWQGERALEGEARLMLARAERLAGHTETSLQEAAAAAQVFDEQGRPARAVEALLLASETAWQARRSDQAAQWVDRGLQAARAVGDHERLARLLSLAATLANLRGDYGRASAYREEAARTEPAPGRAAVVEPPRGGRLVVGLANPVRFIEPATIEINEEYEIAANVFDTLLTTDAGGNLAPSLCAAWQALDGGRAFQLTLRHGVSFSDGSLLTAQAVKASIEACVAYAEQDMPPAYAVLRGSGAFRAGSAPAIEGVVVGSDDTLELRLVEPLPIYPALLTHLRTAVARSRASTGAARASVLGTGAFRVTEHVPGRVVLERNAGHWRSGLPRLEAIEFRSGLTATELARGFRAGEIDLARDLLPEDLEALLRDARFRHGLVETPKSNTYFALFSCRTGPHTRSEQVRRALGAVVRASELVWRTLGRFAAPAVCLIPPGLLGHDAGRRGHSLTIEEARRALDEAGVPAKLQLRASVHPVLQDRYATLLAALRASWAELGVEISVETGDMAAFLASFEKSEGLDLLIGRWNTDYDDPDNFTHTLFHSSSGHYRSWYCSEAADHLLEEARTESRPAAREAHYRKFEGLLAEAGALIPLFHDIDYRLAGPRVRGLRLRSSLPSVNFAELGLLEAGEPAAERPRTSGVLHVPMVGTVTTIDPALGYGLEYLEVMPCIYETLTRDAGGAGIVPWLAAEFRAEEGGGRYRFRLRDDVRFHDGRRLGARDVRHSFERLLHSDSEPRWLLSSIRGARAVLSGERSDLEGFRIHSASEFTIELEEAIAFFPALIAFDNMMIVPEGADPSAGLEGCVGTGPFRLVSFDPGVRLELERNRLYWRKGHPRTDGLVFSFGIAPAEIASGLRAGRFSLAADLFPADAEALRRDPVFASGYRENPRLTTYFVALNALGGRLADRELRRRLNSVIDAPDLVRRTLGRLAIPAASLIPPGLLGHDAALGARVGAMAAAEAAPGAAVELTAAVHPVFSAAYSAFFQALTRALARAGITIRPVTPSYEEFLEAVNQARVDLVIGRWNGDYPDADTFAYALHSQGGFLGRFCGSPELDRLIQRGRTETLASARHGLYREIEETISREALLIPLFHEQAYRFARPEVQGLSVSFTTGQVAYEDLQLRD